MVSLSGYLCILKILTGLFDGPLVHERRQRVREREREPDTHHAFDHGSRSLQRFRGHALHAGTGLLARDSEGLSDGQLIVQQKVDGCSRKAFVSKTYVGNLG